MKNTEKQKIIRETDRKGVKNLLCFLIQAGKLKKIKRSGWILRGVKNPESIAGHTFRMAIMAWILGRKKKLNMEKIIKIALMHDLCEVFAGDTTPYDKIFLTDKSLLIDEKKRRELFEKWPRFIKKEKEEDYQEKHKKESKALHKLILNLPKEIKKEIEGLWLDYEKGLTKEGRFMRQVDRVENLLQAFEYKKEDKDIPIRSFYVQIKELVDDPTLLEFIKELENKFGKI